MLLSHRADIARNVPCTQVCCTLGSSDTRPSFTHSRVVSFGHVCASALWKEGQFVKTVLHVLYVVLFASNIIIITIRIIIIRIIITIRIIIITIRIIITSRIIIIIRVIIEYVFNASYARNELHRHSFFVAAGNKFHPKPERDNPFQV